MRRVGEADRDLNGLCSQFPASTLKFLASFNHSECAFGKVLFKDLSGQLELCAKISPHRREATTFSDEFHEIHHIVNL